MKWWGWGADDVAFPMDDKPHLWPWIRQRLNLVNVRETLPISRHDVLVPPPVLHQRFCAALHEIAPADRIWLDDDTRLQHTAGKSYPNLLKMRAGTIARAPDLVVGPRTRDQVLKIIKLAHQHDICIIPFGGGTNIVGGVDPLASEHRMIVSLDIGALDKVIEVNRYSMTAVIEAGMTGPKLEAALGTHGLSLGHFPDSFEYSTLGGWLATRSAGMQSDAYGRIEDMVLSMRVATPTGEIVTRCSPASASGPSVDHLFLGSEGVLGVITEATMQVHAVPPVKDYFGLLFRSFEDGVAAIHNLRRRGIAPSLIRLQDRHESELAFRMKRPTEGFARFLQETAKTYLRYKRYDAPCIMIIGFEGDRSSVAHQKANAISALKRSGGFVLGGDVGASWSKDKYNIPYLRDFVMDRGIMCDVAETATTWDRVVDLYRTTIAAVHALFEAESQGYGFIGCHISHTYPTGACLYFTYAVAQTAGDELAQYYRYKKTITDVFMQSGATLTHHHAVGSEHLPWMTQELSPAAVSALRSVKAALDPRGIMNPGKLIPMLLHA